MDFPLPPYDIPVRTADNSKSAFSVPKTNLEIFDVFRRRWVRLTAEEKVRQQILHHLTATGYPQGRIAVEKEIDVNGTRKRCDAIVYDGTGRPLVIIECKAERVRLTQAVFDQAAVYNSTLNVPYLLLTNGRTHYFCRIDAEAHRYLLLENFPIYAQLTENTQ